MFAQQLHPARGPLQKRQRTHQHCGALVDQRQDNALQQTHVVVEGQPRHRSRRNLLRVLKVIGHELFAIGDDVSMRDNDTGRLACRPRGVLQIRRIRMRIPSRVEVARGVLVERVHRHDDRRRSIWHGARPRCIFADLVNNRQGRKNDGWRAIPQCGRNALVVNAELRRWKRYCNQAGL